MKKFNKKQILCYVEQSLGKIAGHSNTLMFGYFTLVPNGSRYSVVLLLLLTDHNYYSNYHEFTCHVPLKG